MTTLSIALNITVFSTLSIALNITVFSTKKYSYFLLFLHKHICYGYSLEVAQTGTFNQGNLPKNSSILPINLILGTCIIQHKYQINIMLEDNISILFFHYI